MISDLFKVRRIGFLNEGLQVVLLILTYLVTVGFYYWTWRVDGTFFGLAPSWHLIFVPFYEEFIFRGFLLGAFYERYGKGLAIAVSSLLFGLWHLKNFAILDSSIVLQQVLYATFIIGPLFAWLTLRYRTLWPAVMLHVVNNIVLAPLSLLLLNTL